MKQVSTTAIMPKTPLQNHNLMMQHAMFRRSVSAFNVSCGIEDSENYMISEPHEDLPSPPRIEFNACNHELNNKQQQRKRCSCLLNDGKDSLGKYENNIKRSATFPCRVTLDNAKSENIAALTISTQTDNEITNKSTYSCKASTGNSETTCNNTSNTTSESRNTISGNRNSTSENTQEQWRSVQVDIPKWNPVANDEAMCMSTYSAFDTFDTDDEMVIAAFDQQFVDCDSDIDDIEYELVQINYYGGHIQRQMNSSN